MLNNDCFPSLVLSFMVKSISYRVISVPNFQQQSFFVIVIYDYIIIIIIMPSIVAEKTGTILCNNSISEQSDELNYPRR